MLKGRLHDDDRTAKGAVFLFALQWENKKARKGGVLPSAHQIALLQFQIHLVFFVEVQQDSVGGGFSCDVFVTGERRDDWLSIQHQIHLNAERKSVTGLILGFHIMDTFKYNLV